MLTKPRHGKPRPFQLFIIVWFALNLIQAVFTPLNNDEAYYWMYSGYPAWGYFDHPPMIAMMIKAGYMIVHNEAGVRIASVILSVLTLVIAWNLVEGTQEEKKGLVYTFILLVLLLPVVNIFGFMATPDSPLLFFSALFLLAHRRFVREASTRNTIFLALAMAALVYSKYHGVLLILLVILSDIKLLLNRKFLVSGILAFLLFIPHILWQYNNGFPSLKYHLVERVSGFNLSNLPEFILNLFLIHNPFLLPIFIFVLFKRKPAGSFERALLFSSAGFIVFFLFQSLRYHIEPQWTAVIALPMLVIMTREAGNVKAISKYVNRTAPLVIVLLLVGRIALMVDILPLDFLKKEYHNNRSRAQSLAEIAGGRPLVFTNSYQDPSEYTFYTGQFAHSLNNLNYRKTQYDLWDFEEQLHEREVLYVPHYLNDFIINNFSKKYLPGGDSVYYKIIPAFQSLQRKCILQGQEQYTLSNSDTNRITLKVFNPYPYGLRLKHPELPIVFQAAFLKDGYRELKINLELPQSFEFPEPGDTVSVGLGFMLDELPEGTYKMGICSETGYLYDVYNSDFSVVQVRKGK